MKYMIPSILALAALCATSGLVSFHMISAEAAVPVAMATDKAEQVDVCHVPPGKPENAHTIQVAPEGVPAHLAHGDIACSCEDIDFCEEQGGVLDEETCKCALGVVCEDDWTCDEVLPVCGTGGLGVCGCDLTVEGKSFCWQNTLCSETPPCVHTSDCPDGSACVTTCCGQTCVPECANPGEMPEGQLKKSDGPTASGQ